MPHRRCRLAFKLHDHRAVYNFGLTDAEKAALNQMSLRRVWEMTKVRTQAFPGTRSIS